MTKREWQIEMANRFAKRGMPKDELDTRSYLIGRYDSTKELTDEEISLPQREWVGLTDEELTEIRLKTFDSVATNHEVYRVIEARLKEKNT